ncbi:hypothetical protein NEFER01_1977 [Nematocida sp. LUAm1]|nr:hypothetical protein NEFER02_1859 [Nematocida sp. LUAm2]KAI5179110.1 hypothetical protein NEFER01_1977 [Nematocida sp. LUAm1]
MNTTEKEIISKIQEEYRAWSKPKEVERTQKTIGGKGYTVEQVFSQVERVTEKILADAEDYLVNHLAEEDVCSDDTSSSAQEESAEELHEEVQSVEESADESTEEVHEEEESAECSDEGTIGVEESSKECGECEDGEENEENDEENDEDEESFCSEEKEEILHYLENGDSEDSLLSELGTETLKKLSK